MAQRFTKPIEKERSSSYGTNYLICRSRKLSRRITAFNNITFDGLMTLEMNPEVLSYCERPLEEQVFIDGKRHVIRPDVYVEYRDGHAEFQWFRYYPDKSENLDVYTRAWSLQNDENVKIRYAEDVYMGTFYIRNLCYLAVRSRRGIKSDSGFERALIYHLKDHNETSVIHLINAGFFTREHALSIIADMFYRGIISIKDIENRPISLLTEVSLL